MEIFLAILFILGTIQIILFATMVLEKSVGSNSLGSFVLGSGITMIAIMLITLIVYYSTKDIPAIEVYRGNTELQIIYQDSIPIDSVVVYKNK